LPISDPPAISVPELTVQPAGYAPTSQPCRYPSASHGVSAGRQT